MCHTTGPTVAANVVALHCSPSLPQNQCCYGGNSTFYFTSAVFHENHWPWQKSNKRNASSRLSRSRYQYLLTWSRSPSWTSCFSETRRFHLWTCGWYQSRATTERRAAVAPDQVALGHLSASPSCQSGAGSVMRRRTAVVSPYYAACWHFQSALVSRVGNVSHWKASSALPYAVSGLP